MRFLTVIAACTLFVGYVAAQSPVVTVCSTAVATTVTSPSASCTPTPCAPCNNGNYISSQISSESVTMSFATSSILSLLNASPVATNALSNALNDYSYKLTYPQIDVNQLTCLSTSDIDALLVHVGNTIDQLSQLMDQVADGIAAAYDSGTWNSYYGPTWVSFAKYRLEQSSYYTWLSQGCVNPDSVTALNNKIDAFKDAHAPFTQTYWNPVPYLKQACQNVLVYSNVAGTCPPAQCRATDAPVPSCASCQVAAASVSSFRSNLASATSSISAIVAYATVMPYRLDNMVNLLTNIQSSEWSAYFNIPGDDSCWNSDQAHSFLEPLISFTNTLTWAIEQAAYLEFPMGGKFDITNKFITPSYSIIASYLTAVEQHLSNPSSCYDCNEVAAYNAAIADFVKKMKELNTFSGLGVWVYQAPSLGLPCTTCPVSSASSVFSSTLISSSADSSSPDSSSADSASVDSSSVLSSSDASSSISLEASSDMSSASSADPTSLSLDISSTSLASSTAASSSVSSELSASGSSSVSSGDASSSAGPSLPSIESSVTSAEPTGTSSISASSASFDSFSSLGSATSVEASGSASSVSASAKPSISVDPTVAPSTGLPSISLEASSFGYFNSSSPSSTSESATVNTVTYAASTTAPATHTLTSVIAITLPCSSCLGGTTIIGITPPPSPKAAPTANGVGAITTTLTVPCPICPGGTTTFTSVYAPAYTFTSTTVVTEPCTKCPGSYTTSTTTYGGNTVGNIPQAPTIRVTTSTGAAFPPPATSIAASAVATGSQPSLKSTTTFGGSRGITSAVVTSVSVAVIPSESISTSVVAANNGNKNSWALALLLAPALFGW